MLHDGGDDHHFPSWPGGGDEVQPWLSDLTTWIDQCVGTILEDGANPFPVTTVDFVAAGCDGDCCDVDGQQNVDDLMTGADDLEGDVAVGHESADPEGHSFLHLQFYSHLSQGPNPSGVDVGGGDEWYDLYCMDQVIH